MLELCCKRLPDELRTYRILKCATEVDSRSLLPEYDNGLVRVKPAGWMGFEETDPDNILLKSEVLDEWERGAAAH